MPVRKVNYVDIKVPNRSGTASSILKPLQEARVNLLAFTGFPDKGGKSQVDLVSADMAGVRRVAKKQGWRVGKAKRAFLITGKDRVGAGYQHTKKLAAAKINMTAIDAVCAGKGRFGAILWVKPKDYARAARALGAK